MFSVEDALWEAFPEECGIVGVTAVTEVVEQQGKGFKIVRPPEGQNLDITHTVELLAASTGLIHYTLELAKSLSRRGEEVTPERLQAAATEETAAWQISADRKRNIYIVIAKNFQA